MFLRMLRLFCLFNIRPSRFFSSIEGTREGEGGKDGRQWRQRRRATSFVLNAQIHSFATSGENGGVRETKKDPNQPGTEVVVTHASTRLLPSTTPSDVLLRGITRRWEKSKTITYRCCPFGSDHSFVRTRTHT